MTKLIGSDKLNRKLRDLQRRTQKMHGQHSVPFNELFNPTFMRRHTSYGTINEFIEASGFKVESQEDFENIPEDQLDAFVRGNSRFSSWKEMLQTAGTQWMSKGLGL